MSPSVIHSPDVGANKGYTGTVAFYFFTGQRVEENGSLPLHLEPLYEHILLPDHKN